MSRALSGLLFLSASLLVAQQDRGTFTGTVTDPTGSVVPNVTITIQNVETNATYESRTNEVGQYTVPNLPVGRYRIMFEAPGFKRFVRDGLALSTAQVVRIDVRLELGPTVESVEVTAPVPLLQTETPEVGTVLEQRRVIDLPLSFSGGRYPEDFAYRLTPGVEGNNWTSRINGGPAFSKEVVLDGASATVYIAGHFGESSVSMEALEEFKVQTSGLSAEYGRTAGGIFNFVMKSGTNQIRGSAMGQLRNEWMNSNTFANNFYGRPKQRDRRHNYAFSLGGPVYLPGLYDGKDKTFFYVAYEKYSEVNRGFGSPNRTVPLLEWYDGDMSRYLTTQIIGRDGAGRDVPRGAIYDPATTRTVAGTIVRDMFPGNIIPRARISRVSQRVAEIMKKWYPPLVREPDGRFAMINNSFFPVYNTASFDQKQFSIKADQNLSNRQKLSGMFAWVTRPRVLLDQGGVWSDQDPNGGPLSKARLQTVETYMARVSHDYTFNPTLLNHLTLAFNRQLNPSVSKHVNEPGGEILGIANIGQKSNYPEINWSGGDRVNLANIGYNKNDAIAAHTYQLANTVSWIKGRHTAKFGLDMRRFYLSYRDLSGPAAFNFNREQTGLPGFPQTGHPFASFLLGEVHSASVPVGTPTTSEIRTWAWFVNDDFKVRRNLTLNLGLRWDYQPVQTERFDRLFTFTPEVTDPQSGLPGAIVYAGKGAGRNGKRGFVNNHYNDFGPRVGLAWQVRDRLAFRAGYGIYFNPRVPNDWTGDPWGGVTWFGFGWGKSNTVTNPGSLRAAFNWDQGYPGVLKENTLDPSAANYLWGAVSWDPDAGRVGYTQQWNANIQFELPGQMVLDLGYVGTQSTGITANQLRQILQVDSRILALGDILGQWIDRDEAIPAAAKALGARYPFKTPGTWMPVQQTLQPFPQVPYWNSILSWGSPLGFATYNSLQVSLNKRYSHGLNWLANYTFSKSLDNLESAFNTWMNYGRPMDYYNLKLEKTVSPYDRAHIVKVGFSWELPVGKGKRFGSALHPALDAVLGGWTLQFIGNWSSGEPLGFSGTATPNANFATNRALIVNPNREPLGVPFDTQRFDMSLVSTPGTSAHRYVNTAIVRDPPRYVRGNASYRFSQIRGFAFYGEDFGLRKNFTVKERFRFQIRGEWLNAFNRHRFTAIDTNPASPLFGQVVGVSDVPRQAQVGIRLDF